MDGVDLVPVVMGLFGIGEVLYNLEQPIQREVFNTKFKNLFPNLQDWIDSKWAIIRGTVIGFFLGILPGGGAVIASFASYAIEKKPFQDTGKIRHRNDRRSGRPEAANNAAAGGAFIPLMTLGIPGNVVMAILLGALVIHGIQPGPMMIAPTSRSSSGV